VLLAVPAAVDAHSSVLRERGSTLVYEQLGSKPEFETNRLTVTDGSGDLRGYWRFRDAPTVGITNRPPCVPLDPGDEQVVCPTTGFKELLVLTKLGRDRVTIATSKTVEVHGGVGNDRLYGGPGRSRLFGETGDDRLVAGRNGGATLDGGTGIDVLDARNGKRDTIVVCGDDEVKRDAADVTRSGC
jgi:Ca2+-binding RTX toxin-like protein